jgi:ketosteroid isomerase-like protein
MTDRAHIAKVIGAIYEARVAGDAAGTVKDFADDGVFTMNARGVVEGLGDPVVGKMALKSQIQTFIDTWKFDDWKQVSLIIDGEQAVLHWRARVTHKGTGKSEVIDCVDVVTFRDGMIADYRQNTDTAMMMRLAS